MKKIFILILSLSLTINTSRAEEFKPFWQQSKERAIEILQKMTLPQKIGQLFTIGAFSYKDEVDKKLIENLIKNYHIGGLIFLLGSLKKQIELTNHYQSIAEQPLLISQDCECGLRMRLPEKELIKFPHNMTLGAIQDENLIYELGNEIGKQCRLAGIGVNFAPVVDINNNPQNPIINDRSFGENKVNVARKGILFMKGMQEAGVMACAKHFPGHGNTEVDSHLDLPTLHQSFDELKEQELYPFAAMFNYGVQAAMIGHLNIPSLDNNFPSSLSPIVAKNLLQHAMGFQGLVFTDSLQMKAISKNRSLDEAAKQAIIAGADNIVFCDFEPNPRKMLLDVLMSIKKLIAAVKKYEISEEEINFKVFKILMAKQWLGLFENRFVKPIDNLYEVTANDGLKQKLFDEAVTLVKNDNLTIPLSDNQRQNFLEKIAIVQIGESASSDYVFESYNIPTLKLNNDNKEELLEQINSQETIIVAMHSMNKDSKQNWGVSQESLEFLDRLKEENKQIILILFGNPYSLKLFGKEDAIIVAYEDEIEAVISAFDIIAGRTTAKGKLPITASEQFEEGSGFTFQSKCILFPPLLLPIAVYLYNDEHKHKKIEGNKNV